MKQYLIYAYQSTLLLLLFIPLTGCIVAAAGAGAEVGYLASQEERTVGETVSDQAIVTAVKSKLLADSDVSGFDINVDSFKGVVTLTGVVESQAEIHKAIQLAYDVSGVDLVDSQLFVKHANNEAL